MHNYTLFHLEGTLQTHYFPTSSQGETGNPVNILCSNSFLLKCDQYHYNHVVAVPTQN